MTVLYLDGRRTSAVLGYLDGNPIIDATHPDAERCVQYWKKLQKNVPSTWAVESTGKNSYTRNTIFSYFIKKRQKSQGDFRR